MEEDIAVARLFARLLRAELDEPTLRELRAPQTAEALHELGIEVPPAGTPLDDLHAAFFEQVLRPHQGPPPVQGLWQDGDYGSACENRVLELARAAGLDFDGEPQRNLPADHLSSLLDLWSALRSEQPELAERLWSEHLEWAASACSRLADDGSFYGQIHGALSAWLMQANRP